jgi:uncharacterized protein YndB with AHSA1/START domain
VSTNTIRLHRVLRTTPEKIYRAFLDAEAMVKWLPPNGFTGKVHHLDARVGGTYKMSFTNFTTAQSHSFGGEFLELTPNERIRHTVRIPGQAIHPFQSKASTDSNRSHPVIPAERIQRFQREAIQFLATAGIGGGHAGIA